MAIEVIAFIALQGLIMARYLARWKALAELMANQDHQPGHREGWQVREYIVPSKRTVNPQALR